MIVFGYQREAMPLPFSPVRLSEAPGASMPPRRVRFRTSVRKPCSRTSWGCFLEGVRARSVSAGEAKERWPLMQAEDVIGAVWSPDDGRVGPSDLCAALAKGVRARGEVDPIGWTGIANQ